MTDAPLSSSQPNADPAVEPHWKETENEIADRHWNEILQELRVAQTGTQILTGFLLTLSFQARFTSLSTLERDVYLGLVIAAALTTVMALAPVSLHRGLFRQGVKARMVRIGDIILRVTLGGVATVLVGTVFLIFNVVSSMGPAIIASVVTLIVVLGMWIVLPTRAHPKHFSR